MKRKISKIVRYKDRKRREKRACHDSDLKAPFQEFIRQ
jgi:hypothetical protein